jgi:hypothetical protein
MLKKVADQLSQYNNRLKANILREEAKDLRNNGKNREAIEKYTAAINYYNNDSESYYGRGMSHQTIQ